MKTPFNAFKKLQYEQRSLTYTAGKIKTNLILIMGLLKNAHSLKSNIVCCVALQTAPLNVCHYTPRGSVFARLAYEHILKSCGFYRQGTRQLIIAPPCGNALPVNSPLK